MSEPTPHLRTDRLELGPLAETDADEMSIVLADPMLYAFIGGEPPNPQSLHDRFARLVVGHSADGSEDWHNWIVRTAGDAVAVGTMQRPAVAARAGLIATDEIQDGERAWRLGPPRGVPSAR